MSLGDQKGEVDDEAWAARVSSPRKREGARKEKLCTMISEFVSWYFESERGIISTSTPGSDG
jgi:hypothetical protein